MILSLLRCMSIFAGVIILITLADAGCPVGFTEYNMACYHIGNSPASSATDAFAECYAMGGYLLNVNAKLENDYVTDVIAKQQKKYDGYWIGGYYNGQVWLWQRRDSYGQTINEYMNPEAGFYQWGPYQPDDGLSLLYAQYYVAIMVRGRGVPYSWYSENNNVRTLRGMSYVCEADWKE